jgi:hypothetical protein
LSSAVVAAWIAYVAFAVLVAVGLVSGELSVRGLVAALLACAVGRIGLSYVPSGDAMFPSVVAVVDIVLVLVVVKSDVRI